MPFTIAVVDTTTLQTAQKIMAYYPDPEQADRVRSTTTHFDIPRFDRLRQDLLYRLRWNIFAPLDDIRVIDYTTSTLTPFADHAIASESLADPPVDKLHVYIDACHEKEALDESDGGPGEFTQPDPLILEGNPITLGQFVSQTHAYLLAHRAQIVEVEDEMYSQPRNLGNDVRAWEVRVDDTGEGNIPPDARFWFDGVSSYKFHGEEGDDSEGEEEEDEEEEGDLEGRDAEKGCAGETQEEWQAFIGVHVEENEGVSMEEFWERRDKDGEREGREWAERSRE
jgi:hypothetical protein